MKNLIISICLIVLTACSSTVRDVNYHLNSQEIRSLNRGVVELVVPKRENDEEDIFSMDNLDTLGRKHVAYCTGVFVGQKTILTAAHCVARTRTIEWIFGRIRVPTSESPIGDLKKVVSFQQFLDSGTEMTSYRVYEVIKFDQGQDLALLKLHEGQTRHLNIRVLHLSNRNADFGQRVYAIGAPGGLSWSITDGIVSYPKRMIRNRIPDSGIVMQKTIQVSSPVYFGNSGGPLLNNNGEIIGIASKLLDEPHLAFFTHRDAIEKFLKRIRLT